METSTLMGLLTLVVFSLIGIIHELLHLYCAHKLGYTTKISPRFFKKIIPYAIAVELEKDGVPLQGRWSSWKEDIRNEYNSIAMFPYLFIIPFSFLLLLTKNPILMFWSTGITVWHFFNYPLEWLVK